MADARRLKQVLLNLISNAIKYNRPGGSLTVRSRPDGIDGVGVDVIDSGTGMTYEQLTRLFQPFERLDAPLRGIDGTGLGLVVSKALIEAMNGEIDVASTPGTGSVFSVPARKRRRPRGRSPRAGAAPGRLSARRPRDR